MSKRLLPLLDRVLVEKIVAPTKTATGVLLPESSTASKVRERKWREGLRGVFSLFSELSVVFFECRS